MSKLVAGVGVYTDGKYRAKVDGKHTDGYEKWRAMLVRCYSPTHKMKYPCYNDCVADESFHHFQSFMLWYENQVGFQLPDYQLDKDLLIRGNTVYSPETCLLLPTAINRLLIRRKSKRGDYPIGCWLHPSGKFGCSLTVEGRTVSGGYFNSALEAHKKYKQLKESHVRRLAEIYKPVIDSRAYIALATYEVFETD